MWMRRGLWLLLLTLGCSSGDRTDPPAPALEPVGPTAMGASERRGSADDPLAGLDRDPEPDEYVQAPTTGPAASPTTVAAAVPPHGCVALAEAPVTIWPRPGPAAITAIGRAFVVAAYAPGEHGGEELVLLHVSPDSAPRPLRTAVLERPQVGERTAAPGLATVDNRRVLVVAIDGAGRVLGGQVVVSEPSAQLTLTPLGEGADTRFIPAVWASSRLLAVAWTEGGATPMRTRLVTLGPDLSVASRRDVTPTSMGASAPVFARGPGEPTLFFVDARAGVSPILRVVLRGDGSPGTATVARPVGTVTSPPRIAVANANGVTHVAYTAVGNLATTAVGLVRLDGEAPPTAIVPGTGYGPLHVDAAAGPAAVIFAADAPKEEPPGSPRQVHLRVSDAAGLGPALVFEGPDGRASLVAVARAADGTVGVVFRSGQGIYAAWARCDDEGG